MSPTAISTPGAASTPTPRARWSSATERQKETTMQELLVDFITSLEGCASADGWPGWWGLEGPEYLGWLDEQPERDYTLLMGANTYRLMSGFASELPAEAGAEEAESISELTNASKVVFSNSLQAPLSWANTEL